VPLANGVTVTTLLTSAIGASGKANGQASASEYTPPPLPKNIRSREFLLNHISKSLEFFDTSRSVDKVSGGLFHFFGEDATVFDKDTRVLVTEARFIFTYAVAWEYFKEAKYKAAVEHAVAFLRKEFRNQKNGGYHWVLKRRDGFARDERKEKGGRESPMNLLQVNTASSWVATESKIYTYALAFVLLAYSKATSIGFKWCSKYIAETFDLMDAKIWDADYGLYAEEADADWNVDPHYRSQSGNLHATEALIAAYEATGERRYLDRAFLIASNICRRQAALCGTKGPGYNTTGLIWEHYRADWTPNMDFNNDTEGLTIFRPWGFQPGHQVEWARFLIILERYGNFENGKGSNYDTKWLIPKALYLFDVAIKYAWDPVHKGLAYSFDPDGQVCDWDKIFWVHCESLGTAGMLALTLRNRTGENILATSQSERYWGEYHRIWEHSWKHLVDHKNGSWHRRCNRQNKRYFNEKTKQNLCVDPDYHILGAFDGMLKVMKWSDMGTRFSCAAL